MQDGDSRFQIKGRDLPVAAGKLDGRQTDSSQGGGGIVYSQSAASLAEVEKIKKI